MKLLLSVCLCHPEVSFTCEFSGCIFEGSMNSLDKSGQIVRYLSNVYTYHYVVLFMIDIFVSLLYSFLLIFCVEN